MDRSKKKFKILTYSVPIVALVVVVLHFILVKTTQLSPWKGGGFGMYAEMHYYYYDIEVSHLNKPIDSVLLVDRKVARFLMDLKRMPNDANLERMGQMVSKYATNDTITIQLWKPLIDAKTSAYSRELLKQYHYIQP